MRALRGAIVIVLALALPARVLAADYQAGLEAFQRDDYATALKELRPLAEQGNAEAQDLLGRMYSAGFGVNTVTHRRNAPLEAFKWIGVSRILFASPMQAAD
jgi:TPR repeat protein